MRAVKHLGNFEELGYRANNCDSQSILIVQDYALKDKSMVATQLEQSGYKVGIAQGFQEGLTLSTSSQASLVVMDWDEATELSLAFIIAFKQNPLTKNIPLIFVTTTFNDQKLAEYLQAGVDDYVIKPCLNCVLNVRVKFALLKLNKLLRASPTFSESKHPNLPKIKFDSYQRMIFLDFNGNIESIELCPIGYKILYLLAQNPDRPVSRAVIKKYLCGTIDSIDDRSIDVYIRRLRLTLSKSNIEEIIRTVRGVGYSFNSSLVKYLLV
ncbi:winged helix-turn-helix domain-containing protein [Acinetobacter baumannii]